jgi:hypothetical protein
MDRRCLMVNKGAVVVGSLAVGGALFLMLTKKAKAEPEEGEIIIEIYDSDGNPLPHNSPFSLEEGESYTVKLTIKNTSTQGGTPVAVSLGIGISASAGGTTLIASRVDAKSFAAGETKTFSYSLVIPMGLGGESGTIAAWAEAPDGTDLATAQESLVITEMPIDYGATIVIS